MSAIGPLSSVRKPEDRCFSLKERWEKAKASLPRPQRVLRRFESQIQISRSCLLDQNSYCLENISMCVSYKSHKITHQETHYYMSPTQPSNLVPLLCSELNYWHVVFLVTQPRNLSILILQASFPPEETSYQNP